MSNCWNPRREAEEELGIAGGGEHGQFYFEDKIAVSGAHCSAASLTVPSRQEDEVSEVCWLTPEEITARCDEFARLAESVRCG